MKTLLRRPAGDGGVDLVVSATERSDGDLHPLHTRPETLARRQRSLTGHDWVMTDQVHGVSVHTVDPSDPAADAVVAARNTNADVIDAAGVEVPVAIWAADCAPIVLLGRRGRVVVAHAGWRGLAAGVVDVAVERLARSDDDVAAAVLGPVIHPCCYEFGAADLAHVAVGVGAAPHAVSATTAAGEPALDVPAAVAAALGRHGIELDVTASCTGCARRWFSHRRGDGERHALVVWLDRERVGDGC